MATTQKTIDIIFAGIDQATSTIEKVGGGLGSLSDFTAPMAELTKGILAVETALAAVGVAILKARQGVEKETLKMEAALNIPADRAKELADVARNLYGQSFAESIEQGANAVKVAFSRFGDDSTVNLEKVSQRALALQGIFGVDVSDSITAVESLVSNFGITSDEAFDLLTKGLQEGLNGSDDLFQSIGEFSTQFAESGATAQQFFGIMDSGYEAGVLGTDKAADAIKEFRLKILEMSDDVRDNLGNIGINADDMATKINDGSLTAIEAFQQVYTAIQNTTGVSDRFRAGQTLIGTQWEDLGKKAGALDLVGDKYKNLEGQTDRLIEKTREINTDFSAVWRAVVNEVEKLDVWNKFYDDYKETITSIIDNLPKAFSELDLSGVEKVIGELQEKISSFFGDADITTVDGLRSIIQKVIDTFVSFQNTANGVVESFRPAVELAQSAVDVFNNLDKNTQNAIGSLAGFGAQVSVVTGAIAGGAGLVAGLSSVTGLLGGGGAAAGGLAAAAGTAAAAVGAAGLGAAVGAGAGTLINEYVPGVESAAQWTLQLVDSVVNFSGTMGQAGESLEEANKRISSHIDYQLAMQKVMNGSSVIIKRTDDALKDFFGEIDAKSILDPIVIDVDLSKVDDALDKAFASIDNANAQLHVDTSDLDEIDQWISDFRAQKDLKLNLDMTATGSSKTPITDKLKDIDGKLKSLGNIGEKSMAQIAKSLGDPNWDNAASALVPESSDYDELSKFGKAYVDTLNKVSSAGGDIWNFWNKSIEELNVAGGGLFDEWLNIDNAKSAATQIESGFDKVLKKVEYVTDSVRKVYDTTALLDKSVDNTQMRWRIEEQLEADIKLREKQLELQEKLIQSQIDYNEAKSERLKGDDALINVTVDPAFQPAAGEILRSLIEMAQIQANESGLEMFGVA